MGDQGGFQVAILMKLLLFSKGAVVIIFISWGESRHDSWAFSL